jgi:hypothetical protein
VQTLGVTSQKDSRVPPLDLSNVTPHDDSGRHNK